MSKKATTVKEEVVTEAPIDDKVAKRKAVLDAMKAKKIEAPVAEPAKDEKPTKTTKVTFKRRPVNPAYSSIKLSGEAIHGMELQMQAFFEGKPALERKHYSTRIGQGFAQEKRALAFYSTCPIELVCARIYGPNWCDLLPPADKTSKKK